MSLPAKAQAPQSFRFESFETLENMQKFIERGFPLGSSRDSMRRTFVNDGKATLKLHPTQDGVEKYIYDINLCDYYIWRWNISADFDDNGRLSQAYLNGNPVLRDGRPKRDFRLKATPGKKETIYKVQRPRPEATKGEKSLGFLLYDLDSDPKTIDDQSLMGAGPSRANPINMGRMVAYEVEPWRSIFDLDSADRNVPYAGDCAQTRLMTRPSAEPRGAISTHRWSPRETGKNCSPDGSAATSGTKNSRCPGFRCHSTRATG
jgi:hypothetical protein